MNPIDHYDDVAVFIGLDVGKSEHHAVALTRRRCDVLYAMLRTGSLYQPRGQRHTALAA